jgi:hypothetical protein
MSGFISTKKPFTYAWLMQRMAYDAGKREVGNDMEDVTGRDRDETRRLLYMALYACRTDRYNLVGTLVNALAHHGSGLDPDEVGEHVLTAVAGGDTAWVRAQIERLTAEEANPDSA